MGNMGGEGNHLIADTSNGACMKLGHGIIRFCGIFWKSDGSGRGEGENFYTFIGSKLVGGGGEPDSDH